MDVLNKQSVETPEIKEFIAEKSQQKCFEGKLSIER